MSSVTPLEFYRKVIDALGVEPGQAVDLNRLKNGSVLIEKRSEP